MKQRVSPEQAAVELGCSPHLVRLKMQSGEWDLGEAVSPEKSGLKCWKYYIYRPKLDRHIGKSA